MSALETFTGAYWAFLRGVRIFEPLPHEFGLDAQDATFIKTQCDIEFKAQK